MFVDLVNACLMATFLAKGENSKFEFISIDCNTVGTIGNVVGKLLITKITLKPNVVILASQHVEQSR